MFNSKTSVKKSATKKHMHSIFAQAMLLYVYID